MKHHLTVVEQLEHHSSDSESNIMPTQGKRALLAQAQVGTLPVSENMQLLHSRLST